MASCVHHAHGGILYIKKTFSENRKSIVTVRAVTAQDTVKCFKAVPISRQRCLILFNKHRS